MSPSIPDGFKRCTVCKHILSEDEINFRFRADREMFYAACRTCERKRDAGHRAKDREVRREAQRRFRRNNLERSKEIKKRWAERNPEKMAAISRHYYQEKYEEIRKRQALYERANPEKKRRRAQTRRALRRCAEGSHTTEELQGLYEFQHGRCGYCGILIFWDIRYDIHVDHKIPLSRGGTNWIDNICLCCQSCNLSKGKKTVEEWSAIRGW